MEWLDALVAQRGDLADDGLAFGVAIVEVGGDADADTGPAVDDEAALAGCAPYGLLSEIPPWARC